MPPFSCISRKRRSRSSAGGSCARILFSEVGGQTSFFKSLLEFCYQLIAPRVTLVGWRSLGPFIRARRSPIRIPGRYGRCRRRSLWFGPLVAVRHVGLAIHRNDSTLR